MSSLEEIFSTENILAYSGVCLDLAVEIPETRSLPGKDFDTLVIPSRGAVPFFLGMAYGLNKLSENFGGVYQDFYQNLGVQETMTSLFHEDIQCQTCLLSCYQVNPICFINIITFSLLLSTN